MATGLSIPPESSATARPPGSEWKSTKAFIFLHVDIGFIETDVDVELHIVMLEVAGEIWKFVKDFLCHFELHIHGTDRKALVGTLHSDAETQVLTIELMHLADCCLDDRLFRKIAGCDRAVGRNTKDAIQAWIKLRWILTIQRNDDAPVDVVNFTGDASVQFDLVADIFHQGF